MPSEPKQVIVIRKDLNMRKGKMSAQAAHASMKVILDNAEVGDDPMFSLVWLRFGMPRDGALHQWIVTGRFKKICVSVDNEQELMEIFSKAKLAGLLCSL